MPSADQVPVKTSHSTMRWHLWVVLIAGSTGSALRAVRPPNFTSHAGWPARYRSPRKRDGFLVALTLCHHGPGHSRDLVGKRDRGHLRRPPRQQCREPRPMLSAVEFGIADHCQRAGREQAAQIPIASFADAAELFLTPARVLLRHEPDPSRKIPPGSESPSITDAGDQSCGQCWPDARDLIEPLTGLIGSVPSHDQAVEMHVLGLQHPQLGAESGETPPRNLGYAVVTGIGDNIEQCLDPIASDRRDDAELGKMGTDRIDHCSLLADEQVACAMQHQTALLLGRLGLNESHVCPGHRFADCLGVGGIVLVSLHVRLDIGWRHQANGVAECLEFARPMMRGCAGLDTDETRRQLLEESNDVTALQLAPDDHIAFRVNAMDLKNRLRDVETNRRDSLHGPVLRIRSPPWRPRSVALTCRWRSRPQHQKRKSADLITTCRSVLAQ